MTLVLLNLVVFLQYSGDLYLYFIGGADQADPEVWARLADEDKEQGGSETVDAEIYQREGQVWEEHDT